MSRGLMHINHNILCAVDTETTGLIAEYHDIHQIAILPLGPDLKPMKKVIPFYIDMQLTNPDRIDKKAIKMNREQFAIKQQRAVDPFTGADLFDQWFERLNLPVHKKIMPLAQNWPFDKGFIKYWLGEKNFEHTFSPLYRDTMVVTQFHSDLMDHCGNPIMFPQYNLQYLCQKLGIKNHKPHDALQDCIATAEVYRRLLLLYA